MGVNRRKCARQVTQPFCLWYKCCPQVLPPEPAREHGRGIARSSSQRRIDAQTGLVQIRPFGSSITQVTVQRLVADVEDRDNALRRCGEEIVRLQRKVDQLEQQNHGIQAQISHDAEARRRDWEVRRDTVSLKTDAQELEAKLSGDLKEAGDADDAAGRLLTLRDMYLELRTEQAVRDKLLPIGEFPGG